MKACQGLGRIEVKYADAPGWSRSMLVAIQDLSLEHLWVIYPGQQEYRLDERISVTPLDTALRLFDTIG
jgi:hypothetical protein